MAISNYKITLYDCKYKHQKINIFSNKFEKTQDESKIICNKCNKVNKSSSFQNQFYICFTCKINLCPLCKSLFDKSHDIKNYNQKYYICYLHNQRYNSYC